MDRSTASYGYLGADDVTRARMRKQWDKLGLTHMTVMLSGQYGSVVPWFYLWDEMSIARARLTELTDAGIHPHLWCLNGETVQYWRQRGMTVQGLWRSRLPEVADLVHAVSVAPEMNDFLCPADQRTYPRLLKSILPHALNLVHFTRKRSHGAHQLAGHPGGPLPSEWRPSHDDQGQETASFLNYWAAEDDAVDGLAYNAGHADMDAALAGDPEPLRRDLGDVSIRLTGAHVPFVVPPLYQGRFTKVLVAMEFGAERVLKGHWTYDQTHRFRQIAESVPGVQGWGD